MLTGWLEIFIFLKHLMLGLGASDEPQAGNSRHKQGKEDEI
jgi:hypothetical protein